ncbi:uracil-DNA glycosylase [Iodidimonas muriae]|uniref:Uracil-DNA glycosylase n=1 Tax=Iodidimonas muriae TaxID=261467 RepID=A0ABQ2LES7_9PROT|nr:uracil-DNA glycosylase [Iodidimonas muriae]GER07168.1 uracil-DNA glycosylase [Kordiimonadales bacterium JCM 17843]GGO12768.1 uracil-DNA glycosylase [Iodidimonas muriae]
MNEIGNSPVLAFLEHLSSLRFNNAFNPYADTCPDCDEGDAPATRRRNLELVLEAALSKGVDSIWIARDLGYRGGRRTGLALTDEVHLSFHAALFGTPPLLRATKGPALAERTATVVWRMLRVIERPIFLWNVFPLHPHEPGDPMSNRSHTRSEREACQPLLAWLLEKLKPNNIVAIGRDAHGALQSMGVKATAVRHPSYGGQAEFISGLTTIYDLNSRSGNGLPQLPLFH